MKDYLIFLSSEEELVENQAVSLTIIDINTLEHMDVMAVITSSSGGSDVSRLWIRIDDLGDVRRRVKPKYIQILERIGEKAGFHEGISPVKDDLLEKRPDSFFTTSERFLKDIVAASEQWIWEITIQLTYSYASATVEKILGYKPQHMVGRSFFDFLMEEEIRRLRALLENSIKERSGFKGFLHRKRHQDGSEIWAEMTGFPICDKQGQFRGWRGVDQDVTRRKHLEEKFRCHQRILSVLDFLNTLQIKKENLDQILHHTAMHLRDMFRTERVSIYIPAVEPKIISAPEGSPSGSMVREKFLDLLKTDTSDSTSRSSGDSMFPYQPKTLLPSRPVVHYSVEEGLYYLSAPIKGQDGTLGWIEFSKPESSGCKDVDLELIDAIGARIGLIIESSCYYAALQKREREVGMISARLVHAQEDERHRISRILHDEVGQLLSSANLILKSAEMDLHAGREKIKSHLADVRDLIQKATRRTRDLSSELRPVLLENIGLTPALQNLVMRYRDILRLEIDFIRSGITERFPEAVELSLFRVAEEALRNVSRHANPDRVSVKLVQTDSRVFLTVRDNGVGFDYTKVVSSPKGLGLKIMQERMHSVGGELQIISRPNEGTLVVASLVSGRSENGDPGIHR